MNSGLRKVLCCCNSYREISLFKSKIKDNYLIATVDYMLYKQLDKKKAIFLESSALINYEKTWGILHEINNAIDRIVRSDSSKYFYLSYNIEGGLPSKISEMVNNLEMIDDIVKKYNLTEFYLFDRKDNWTLNESLYLYASYHNILCKVFEEDSLYEKKCLKTLRSMQSEYILSHEAQLMEDEERRLEIKKQKTRMKDENHILREKEIGILYCCKSSYNKHVSWTMRRAEMIGGNPEVICYYNTDDVGKFNKMGVATSCLEDYFSVNDFINKYDEVKRERTEILSHIISELEVSFIGVNLTKYLVIKLRNLYYRNMLELVYIDVCMKEYFKYNKYDYICVWGDTNFWETQFCYKYAKLNNTKLFVMHGQIFINAKIWQPNENIVSVAFISNNRQKEFYSSNYQGKFCMIPDIYWGIRYRKNGCISVNKKIGIFPTKIVPGYTTQYFYYDVLLVMIEKLLEKGYEIIFKNHPGRTEEDINYKWENEVKRKFRDNKNFIYMNSEILIEKALEECSVAITDISSIVLDAINLQKVSFCIVDEQGYRWISHHADELCIYKDLTRLLNRIDAVLTDDTIYKEIINKQNVYLSKLEANNGKNVPIKEILSNIKEC